MSAVARMTVERVVACLPDAESACAAESRLVEMSRRIVDRLTRPRSAALLGRSESWLARALHPIEEQRLKSGCSLSARDLLVLLAIEHALGDSDILDELALAALGDDVEPEELAAAWDEVGREHLGQVFEGLRHRVLARARSKRLRRAPMRTKRATGPRGDQ